MSTRSPRGTYIQIADALRAQLGNNTAPALLPSEATLMNIHRVSRTTVKRALDVLAAEGLIRSRPGVGWAVVGPDEKPTVLDQLTSLASTLQIGDPFPSEKELAEQTGAARGTVRRALAQLEGAGILEVRHGKGRRVRALPATKA
ncbi:GntR family transcriptional regulator [Kitasatospora purpeofusca]|uniref:GntR family transcriptional regulator n=1 Tax=Kitasatospora purpeofusca TaxID=67352 RepID=UPI00386F5947|nr:GntR family transcriptional regulator [Kitasatospora purpeofusca]